MEELVLLNAKIRARMIAPTIAATVALVVVRAVAQVDVREVVAAGVQLRVVPAVPALQNQVLAQVVVPPARVDVLVDVLVVVVVIAVLTVVIHVLEDVVALVQVIVKTHAEERVSLFVVGLAVIQVISDTLWWMRLFLPFCVILIRIILENPESPT